MRPPTTASRPSLARVRTHASLVALVSVLALPGACSEEGLASTSDEEPVGVQYAEIGSREMPPCGTPIASWNGTTVYSNGPLDRSTGIGTGAGSCGRRPGPYGYEYQCVELVMRHFKRNWGVGREVWRGNATDLLRSAPRGSIDVHYNGDAEHPPVPGDALVFQGTTYGHVALVTAVRRGAIDIIEQNVPGNGRYTLRYDGRTVSSHLVGLTVAGWAHARANGGAPSGGSSSSGGSTPTGCGAYAGTLHWNCTPDRAARVRCVSGSLLRETCSAGCEVRAVGEDDVCVSSSGGGGTSSAACDSGETTYWACNAARTQRSRCYRGALQLDRCDGACTVRASDEDDTCD